MDTEFIEIIKNYTGRELTLKESAELEIELGAYFEKKINESNKPFIY